MSNSNRYIAFGEGQHGIGETPEEALQATRWAKGMQITVVALPSEGSHGRFCGTWYARPSGLEASRLTVDRADFDTPKTVHFPSMAELLTRATVDRVERANCLCAPQICACGHRDVNHSAVGIYRCPRCGRPWGCLR